MKKYVVVYVLIFAAFLAMMLTTGLPWGIVLESYHASGGPLAVPAAELTLQIGNVIVLLICLVAAIVVTFSKSNRIPAKWILFLGVILCMGCVPVLRYDFFGLDGGHIRYFCLFMLGEVFEILPTMKVMQQMRTL